MAPRDPDDDEARTRAADETAGNRFDDGYWATVENRDVDADDVYVMDVKSAPSQPTDHAPMTACRRLPPGESSRSAH